MGHYRVAIIDMSQLMREIVIDALRAAGDMEVVAEEPDSGRLQEVMTTARPDVILTGAEATRPGELWAELFESRPQPRLIALNSSGGATSFTVRPVRATAEDVSLTVLIDMIRKSKEADPVN